jgi:hypothetical protein
MTDTRLHYGYKASVFTTEAQRYHNLSWPFPAAELKGQTGKDRDHAARKDQATGAKEG